jgi:hypothetical protein
MEDVNDEMSEEEEAEAVNSDFEQSAPIQSTTFLDSDAFMRNTQPLEPTVPLGDSQ